MGVLLKDEFRPFRNSRITIIIQDSFEKLVLFTVHRPQLLFIMKPHPNIELLELLAEIHWNPNYRLLQTLIEIEIHLTFITQIIQSVQYISIKNSILMIYLVNFRRN